MSYIKIFLFFMLPIPLCNAYCAHANGTGPDGNCYWAGSTDTWYTAWYKCGSTASVTSAFATSFILQLAQQNGIQGPFWIGGTVNDQNAWVWGDLTGFSYTNWASGEPKTTQKGHCISMSPSTGQWYSTNCSETRPSVCAKLSTPKSLPCPQFYYYYSVITNKCYFWRGDPSPNYHNYQGDCQSNRNGANLLSIHSPVEESVILGFSSARNAPALLGLTDTNHNGTYSWSDGSPVDYTNWGAQPGVDNCVFLSVKTLQWYPMPCSNFSEYLASEICELSPTT